MFSLTRVTCAQHYTVTLHSYNNHFHIYFWQYLLLQFVHIIGEWATPRLSDQRWAKGGLIISKRQDAYALVTISSNTLGQRAARSSCNDYVHIAKTKFSLAVSPLVHGVVLLFEHQLYRISYRKHRPIPTSISKIFGIYSIWREISLCSTTHEVWQTAKNERFRNFHLSLRRAPHINDATRSHCCHYSFVT